MKQFYNMFRDEKVSQLATQLSWSHYVELLPLKNIDEIRYYINICRERNIGRDLLREKYIIMNIVDYLLKQKIN